MEILKKVFRQTGFQVIGKIITTFSSILILGLITRRFGETGTGILTLALTYLAFFSIIVDFGINAHLLPRFLKNDFSDEWRKLFGLRLFLSLVLIIVSLTGILVWPSDELLFKQLVFIGAIFAILEPAIFITANIIFQAKLKYDLSTIAWSLGSLGSLGLIYIFTSFGKGLLEVMVGYVVGWVLMSVLALFFVSKFVKNISPIFDGQYILKVIRDSWPISLTLILNVLYFRVDTFILSLNKSFAEVGVYNLAYQVFQSSLVLPTFIMNGFYPILLKEFSDSWGKFIELLKRSTLMMLGISLLSLVGVFFLSPLIVSILSGGTGFEGSDEVLQILAFSYPAFFVSSLLMWVMVVLKKYREMVLIYLIGLLVNFSLNFIYIPQYSYVAAAIITGVSEYLILILQVIILAKEFRKR